MSARTEAQAEGIRWPIVGAGVAMAAVFGGATLMLADPPPGLRDATANPADSLVEAWTEAAGGADVFDSLSSVSFTVTRIHYDTLTGRARGVESHDVWVQWRPGRTAVRVDHAAGGTTVLGFDGRSAWATRNDTRVPDGSPLQREALRATYEVLRWLESPFALRDSSIALTYRGPASRSEIPFVNEDARMPEAEQEAFHSVAVRMPFPDGVPSEFTYYFNLGERFPSEVTYTDRDQTVREALGTVERAGSTSMAYFARRDVFLGSGSRLETILIADLEVDPDVSAVAFEAPES